MTALGLRLNNPGDIRKSSTNWQGLADTQPDPNFCSFKTPQYGIRAMARNLMNYQARDDCHTVREIISRYAPPSENNTAAYIAAVCAALSQPGASVGPDDQIDVDSVAVLKPLIVAIIIHETGSNPYSDAVIAEGLQMAGVSDAKPKALVKQGPFQAQVAAVATGATGAAIHYGTTAATWAPQIKKAADSLSDYAGAPIIQHIVTVMVTAAGGMALVGLGASILKQRSA